MNRRILWVLFPAALLYGSMLLFIGDFYRGQTRQLNQETGQRLMAIGKSVGLILQPDVQNQEDEDHGAIGETDKIFALEEKLGIENLTIAGEFGALVFSSNPYVLEGLWSPEGIPPEKIKAALQSDTVIILPEKKIGGALFKTLLVSLSSEDFRGYALADVDVSYLKRVEAGRKKYFYGLGLSLLLFLGLSGILAAMVIKILRLEQTRASQQRLALMGEMTASIAHEIKNPLGIIKSTSQMIAKKYGREGEEIFNYIPEEVDKLNRIINDYLTFSKDISLNKEKVKLEPLLSKVCGEYSQAAFQCESLPDIQADPYRITQAVRNLIANGILHGKSAVEVKARAEGDNVILTVGDRGPGISPQDRENIFKPFFSRSSQGTGLGLGICRKITEAHGGRIWVEGRKGGGSLFYLELPKE